MLTRQQVFAYLLGLGFATSVADDNLLVYAHIRVRLLDAPRIWATTYPPGPLVYLAVSSARQLEEQLTGLLGYARPAVVG